MSGEFWQALIGALLAAAGLLSALRQRIQKERIKAKAAAESELQRVQREAADREREAAKEALEFRERLRQEAIAERGKLEDRLEDIAKALREATSVMERSTSLSERVLDLEFGPGSGHRDPNTRTRAADRPPPRRGPTDSRLGPGRSDRSVGPRQGPTGGSRPQVQRKDG